jgi:hypothetical protein
MHTYAASGSGGRPASSAELAACSSAPRLPTLRCARWRRSASRAHASSREMTVSASEHACAAVRAQ